MAQAPRQLTPDASMRHFFGAELRRWRELRGLSQAALARELHVSSSSVGKVEAAARSLPRGLAARCDIVLETDGALAQLEAIMQQEIVEGRTAVRNLDMRGREGLTFAGDLDATPLEILRQRLEDGVSATLTSSSGLDLWEQIIAGHATATRHRSPGALIDDLATDISELERLLNLRQSASTLRALTRLTAQMAGLLSLTLLKANDRSGSRKWARTARRAAAESGDNVVIAWVRAQEAHTSYYAGDLTDAVEIARDARRTAGSTPCVGGALAAALEARALASQGRAREAQDALSSAETIFDGLAASDAVRSALGYDEAQLRFHEGNAYTHLGMPDRAWAAQQRALELYPKEDYLDRALVHLDRAACLVHEGALEAAVDVALAGITELRLDQRRGLVATRAREVMSMLPEGRRALPLARSLGELLREN
jgi:transcriptional regulator with XRE-family HTH domain